MDLILKAARIARYAHQNQQRPNPDELGILRPYIEHPRQVAGMVFQYAELFYHPETAAAIAWLHDVLEDTTLEYNYLVEMVGAGVALGVHHLTNPPGRHHMTRMERQQADWDRLAEAPSDVRVVKCFDRMDNLRSLHGASKEFIKLYCYESELLFNAIGASVLLPKELQTEIARDIRLLREYANADQ